MISLLLVEAVLDQNGRVSEIKESGNDVYIYGPNGEYIGLYNIYELAHKCKEWAFENGAAIQSRRMIGIGYEVTGIYLEGNILPPFHARYEPEAIFKACQWILENK